MDQSHKTNNKQVHHSKSLPSLSPNINALPLVHPQRHSLKHPSSPECSNQHIIPLYYRGKEGEQMDSKMKMLAERSLKKLEGRYETIDRWKKKYIAEGSGLCLKQKNIVCEIGSAIKESKDSRQSSVGEQKQVFTTQSYINHCLLPSLSKNYLHSIIPEQQMKSVKFQSLIRDKLLKNNKYYQSKCNSKNKDQQEPFQTIIAPQKEREMHLKSYMSKKSVIKNGIFNKKIVLSEPYRKVKADIMQNLKNIRRSFKGKVKEQAKAIETQHTSVKKGKKPQNLRERLLWELLQQEPGGWKTLVNMPEMDDEMS